MSAQLQSNGNRRGSARVRMALLQACVVALSVAMTLVALEFAARFIFRDVVSSGDITDYFGTHRRLNDLRTNSLGFREREIETKTPDRYRIAVVGDSFTWGQGIQERERFSNQLERRLSPRYEVFNFGVSGNNLPRHLHVLEWALGVAPDFVLLQLYINDFEMPGMPRPEASNLLPWPGVEQWFHRSSVIYDMLNVQWQQRQMGGGTVESYPQYLARYLGDADSPDARQGIEMLRQFIARTREAGVKIGLILFPDLSSSGEAYPFDYLHQRVRQVCDRDAVSCLDLRAPLASTFARPQEMWLNRFDHHPNARVNEEVARVILAKFGSEWPR